MSEKSGKKNNPNQPWVIAGRDLVMDAVELINPKDYDAALDYVRLKKMNLRSGSDGENDNITEKLVYMHWLLADQNSRKPKTEKEVAIILGRSLQTLRRVWLKSEKFQKLVEKEIESRLLGPEGMSLVSKSVLIKAVKGDVKAQQLWTNLHEKWKAERKTEGEDNTSDEEKALIQVLDNTLEDEERDNRKALKYAKEMIYSQVN